MVLFSCIWKVKSYWSHESPTTRRGTDPRNKIVIANLLFSGFWWLSAHIFSTSIGLIKGKMQVLPLKFVNHQQLYTFFCFMPLPKNLRLHQIMQKVGWWHQHHVTMHSDWRVEARIKEIVYGLFVAPLANAVCSDCYFFLTEQHSFSLTVVVQQFSFCSALTA